MRLGGVQSSITQCLASCSRKGSWWKNDGDDGGNLNELKSSWIVSVDVSVIFSCFKQNQDSDHCWEDVASFCLAACVPPAAALTWSCGLLTARHLGVYGMFFHLHSDNSFTRVVLDRGLLNGCCYCVKAQLIVVIWLIFCVCTVQTDKGFDKSAFAKQMSVMRGQVATFLIAHFHFHSFLTIDMY